jgi:hypothetical protein
MATCVECVQAWAINPPPWLGPYYVKNSALLRLAELAELAEEGAR